jgi:hypothetical protein
MRHSMEKIKAHCIFCKKELKVWQFVYMHGLNGIVLIGKGTLLKIKGNMS